MRKILPPTIALIVGLVGGAAAGFVLGYLYAKPKAGPTVEVELVVAAPATPGRQAVLRYRGTDRAAALAGGNVSVLSLEDVIARDEQDPRAGTVSWRASGVREGGSMFGGQREPIGLRMVRVDTGRGPRWELSDESARRVLEELGRPGSR